jgi:hypothetical protein
MLKSRIERPSSSNRGVLEILISRAAGGFLARVEMKQSKKTGDYLNHSLGVAMTIQG